MHAVSQGGSTSSQLAVTMCGADLPADGMGIVKVLAAADQDLPVPEFENAFAAKCDVDVDGLPTVGSCPSLWRPPPATYLYHAPCMGTYHLPQFRDQGGIDTVIQCIAVIYQLECM